MGVGGRIALALAVVAALAVPSRADAETEQQIAVPWDRILERGTTWLLANMEPERSPSDMHPLAEASRALPPAELGNAWFGVAPNVAIVARDWGDARRLTGRLTLTDQLRLSRSSRMVVARVRLGDARFVPFAQLGAGQWRIDTDLMPGWARDTELAAQFGGGFELHLTHGCALALESDYTVLYREQHEPQNIPFPRFWTGFAASRVQF